MSIPTCYFTKPLLRLIDTLIEDGNNSYSKLSDADKDNVIALCIDSLGDDAYACIIDSDYMIGDLKRFVITSKKEDAITLAHNLHDAAAKYFEDDMNELFEQRSSLYRFNMNAERNIFPSTDNTTGEIAYR